MPFALKQRGLTFVNRDAPAVEGLTLFRRQQSSDGDGKGTTTTTGTNAASESDDQLLFKGQFIVTGKPTDVTRVSSIQVALEGCDARVTEAQIIADVRAHDRLQMTVIRNDAFVEGAKLKKTLSRDAVIAYVTERETYFSLSSPQFNRCYQFRSLDGLRQVVIYAVIGLLQALFHAILCATPVIAVAVVIFMMYTETAKFSLSINVMTRDEGFSIALLNPAAFMRAGTGFDPMILVPSVAVASLAATIMDPIVVVVLRWNGLHRLANVWTAVALVVAGAYVLALVLYFLVVLQWWILGAIVSPQTMLAFATSAFTLVSTLYSLYSTLTSQKKVVVEKLKQRIMVEFVGLVQNHPVEGLDKVQGALSAFPKLSKPGASDKETITFDLLLKVRSRDSQSIAQLADVVGIPPQLVDLPLAIFSRSPQKIIAAIAPLMVYARMPESAVLIVSYTGLRAMDLPVSDTVLADALVSLIPDAHRQPLLRYDRLLLQCAKAVISGSVLVGTVATQHSMREAGGGSEEDKTAGVASHAGARMSEVRCQEQFEQCQWQVFAIVKEIVKIAATGGAGTPLLLLPSSLVDDVFEAAQQAIVMMRGPLHRADELHDAARAFKTDSASASADVNRGPPHAAAPFMRAMARVVSNLLDMAVGAAGGPAVALGHSASSVNLPGLLAVLRDGLLYASGDVRVNLYQSMSDWLDQVGAVELIFPSIKWECPELDTLTDLFGVPSLKSLEGDTSPAQLPGALSLPWRSLLQKALGAVTLFSDASEATKVNAAVFCDVLAAVVAGVTSTTDEDGSLRTNVETILLFHKRVDAGDVGPKLNRTHIDTLAGLFANNDSESAFAAAGMDVTTFTGQLTYFLAHQLALVRSVIALPGQSIVAIPFTSCGQMHLKVLESLRHRLSIPVEEFSYLETVIDFARATLQYITVSGPGIDDGLETAGIILRICKFVFGSPPLQLLGGNVFARLISDLSASQRQRKARQLSSVATIPPVKPPAAIGGVRRLAPDANARGLVDETELTTPFLAMQPSPEPSAFSPSEGRPSASERTIQEGTHFSLDPSAVSDFVMECVVDQLGDDEWCQKIATSLTATMTVNFSHAAARVSRLRLQSFARVAIKGARDTIMATDASSPQTEGELTRAPCTSVAESDLISAVSRLSLIVGLAPHRNGGRSATKTEAEANSIAGLSAEVISAAIFLAVFPPHFSEASARILADALTSASIAANRRTGGTAGHVVPGTAQRLLGVDVAAALSACARRHHMSQSIADVLCHPAQLFPADSKLRMSVDVFTGAKDLANCLPLFCPLGREAYLQQSLKDLQKRRQKDASRRDQLRAAARWHQDIARVVVFDRVLWETTRLPPETRSELVHYPALVSFVAVLSRETRIVTNSQLKDNFDGMAALCTPYLASFFKRSPPPPPPLVVKGGADVVDDTSATATAGPKPSTVRARGMTLARRVSGNTGGGDGGMLNCLADLLLLLRQWNLLVQSSPTGAVEMSPQLRAFATGLGIPFWSASYAADAEPWYTTGIPFLALSPPSTPSLSVPIPTADATPASGSGSNGGDGSSAAMSRMATATSLFFASCFYPFRRPTATPDRDVQDTWKIILDCIDIWTPVVCPGALRRHVLNGALCNADPLDRLFAEALLSLEPAAKSDGFLIMSSSLPRPADDALPAQHWPQQASALWVRSAADVITELFGPSWNGLRGLHAAVAPTANSSSNDTTTCSSVAMKLIQRQRVPCRFQQVVESLLLLLHFLRFSTIRTTTPDPAAAAVITGGAAAKPTVATLKPEDALRIFSWQCAACLAVGAHAELQQLLVRQVSASGLRLHSPASSSSATIAVARSLNAVSVLQFFLASVAIATPLTTTQSITRVKEEDAAEVLFSRLTPIEFHGYISLRRGVIFPRVFDPTQTLLGDPHRSSIVELVVGLLTSDCQRLSSSLLSLVSGAAIAPSAIGDSSLGTVVDLLTVFAKLTSGGLRLTGEPFADGVDILTLLLSALTRHGPYQQDVQVLAQALSVAVPAIGRGIHATQTRHGGTASPMAVLSALMRITRGIANATQGNVDGNGTFAAAHLEFEAFASMLEPAYRALSSLLAPTATPSNQQMDNAAAIMDTVVGISHAVVVYMQRCAPQGDFAAALAGVEIKLKQLDVLLDRTDLTVPMLLARILAMFVDLESSSIDFVDLLLAFARGDVAALPRLLPLCGAVVTPTQAERFSTVVRFLSGLQSDTSLVDATSRLAKEGVLAAGRDFTAAFTDHVFEVFDKDGSGTVSLSEFASLLKRIGLFISETDARSIFNRVDASGDGEITKEEFHVVVQSLQDMVCVEVLERLNLKDSQVAGAVAFVGFGLVLFLSFILLGTLTLANGTDFTAVVAGGLPLLSGGISLIGDKADVVLQSADVAVRAIFARLSSRTMSA